MSCKCLVPEFAAVLSGVPAGGYDSFALGIGELALGNVSFAIGLCPSLIILAVCRATELHVRIATVGEWKYRGQVDEVIHSCTESKQLQAQLSHAIASQWVQHDLIASTRVCGFWHNREAHEAQNFACALRHCMQTQSQWLTGCTCGRLFLQHVAVVYTHCCCLAHLL